MRGSLDMFRNLKEGVTMNGVGQFLATMFAIAGGIVAAGIIEAVFRLPHP